MKKETRCVHSGTHVDPLTGGINTPIFTSSVFKYLDSDKQAYPRYFNTPNQEVVVRKLCELEQAEDGLLFSSGMAAVSTVLLTLAGAGEHVVLQDELYGGTHAFVTQQFHRLGIGYSFAAKDAEALEEAVCATTKAIFIETPTNPLLGIVDIERVAALARSKGLVSVIDNTFASPINQNPLDLGIDVVVHSGTKYLGGHSDICCGAVLASRTFIERLRATAADLGGNLNGETCALLERSLKTLHVRVTRQTENAGAIAEALSRDERISRVYYPGLSGHPGRSVAERQMHGYGAMLSFEIAEHCGPADDFLRRLKLIVPALSLGGIESTICAPAHTSHRKMSQEDRERIGVTDRVLRLSVGIEHPDDLLADIEQALG